MTSSFIGRVQKARQYSSEPTRVSIRNLTASFNGNHGTYDVSFDLGEWKCECPSFPSENICSHTMALQNILEQMLNSTR
ncbi:MAG: hypothetical protein VX966_03215 [Chloroflexota bacterium]|nr:hypothetical protein [Chloroflexota bacterium]